MKLVANACGSVTLWAVKKNRRAIIKKDLRSRFLSNLDLLLSPMTILACSTVDAFQEERLMPS